METDVKKGVTVRLFVGAELTAPLNYHLKNSSAWKEATLLPLKQMQQVAFEKKTYVGIYLDTCMITTQAFQTHHDKILSELIAYCPKLPVSELKITLFPQLFIA